jgi:2,3-dihydroxybenzoate-AMP ligase
VIAAVVPLISAWLASDEPKRFDHSSLKVVQNGGARLAPELRQRLITSWAARRRRSTAPPRA